MRSATNSARRGTVRAAVIRATRIALVPDSRRLRCAAWHPLGRDLERPPRVPTGPRPRAVAVTGGGGGGTPKPRAAPVPMADRAGTRNDVSGVQHTGKHAGLSQVA